LIPIENVLLLFSLSAAGLNWQLPVSFLVKQKRLLWGKVQAFAHVTETEHSNNSELFRISTFIHL